MAIKQPPKPRKFVQDEFTHQPHLDQHPEEHEHTDVNTRALVTFVVGFLVFGVLAHLLLFFLFKLHDRNKDETRMSLVEQRPQTIPPETPLLQGVPGPRNEPRFDANPPAQDMKLFRERNERVLREGETVRDGDKDVYVIPIAEAMRIALDKDIFRNEPKGPHDHQQHQQPGGAGSGTSETRTGGGANNQGQPRQQGGQSEQPRESR